MGVSNEILIKANRKGFTISEVPIVVSYHGDTSTHNPVSHGASVIFSTLKVISIENPLKLYGIPGCIFLAIGLFFTVLTIQDFTETQQILLSTAIIGTGYHNLWYYFTYDCYHPIFCCKPNKRKEKTLAK